MVLPVVYLLLVLGALLLLLGLWGRAGDRVARCRRCKYDLTDSDPAGVCPECGRSLGRVRAIKIGRRKRRWVLAGFGILVITMAGVLFGAIEFERRDVLRWNGDKPAALLLIEARWAWAKRMEAAAEELAARFIADELSSSQRRALVDIALARHGDLDGPWSESLGTAIETLILRDEVWASKALEYLDNVFTITVTAPADLREGRQQFIRINFDGRGIPGRWPISPLMFRAERYSRIDEGEWTRSYQELPFRFASSGMHPRDFELPALGAGDHVIEQRVVLRLDPQATARRMQSPPAILKELENWSLEQEDTIRFTVLPARQIEMVTGDAALRTQVIAGLRLTPLSMFMPGDPPQTPSVIAYRAEAMQIPIDAAFDVYWRWEDREEKIGTLQLSGGTCDAHIYLANTRYFQVPGPFPMPKRADLVLRPNAAALEQGDDWPDRMFGEEIVIEDLEVVDGGVVGGG